jgi:hypothetical protein
MQHPRLNLGLVGFTAEQRTLVEQFLALQANFASEGASKKSGLRSPIPWQITHHREANALLLSTQHASLDDQQIVRFPADAKYSDVVGVRPSELRIPYALVGNTSQSEQAWMALDAPRIELGNAKSMKIVLEIFESALYAVRSLFAMAQLLHTRHAEIDERHTFHLVRRGLLQAVVDVAGQRVMMRNAIQPMALEDAYWLSRPLSANTLPPGFTQWSMDELAWTFAQHSITVNLPKRFLSLPIYLRQQPKVRPWMIYPRQMDLLEFLGQQPRTYPQLAQAFPVRPDLLQRDLSLLLACRAITTTPPKDIDEPPSLLPASADPLGFLVGEAQAHSKLPFELKTMRSGLY